MAECLLVVKYLLVSCIFISAEFKEEEEDLSDVCIHLCFLKYVLKIRISKQSRKNGNSRCDDIGQICLWAPNYFMLSSS